MKKLLTLTVLSFIGLNAMAQGCYGYYGCNHAQEIHNQRMEKLMREQNDILDQQRLQQSFQNSNYNNNTYQPSCYINVAGRQVCY
jgi:hypothetical protein